jgi:segregation and condensation protein B
MAKYFNIEVAEIKKIVNELFEWSKDTPFEIILTENDACLVLNNEVSEIISDLDKKESERELTKASLETLSIILYKNGATRSEIDYIRGVNSSFSVRSLVSKGYIEKGSKGSKNGRNDVYLPTSDLLRFIGISDIKSLPDYENSVNKLEEILKQKNDNN